MKNKFALIIFIVSMMTFSACSNKSTAPNTKEELKQPSIGDKIPSDVATSVFDKAPITKEGEPELGDFENDCHGKRMVTQNIEEAEGSILLVANRYVITTNEGTNRYNPCELPSKLKKDGMLVRFTGEVLEIFPGERLIATPFRLKNVKERDN